MTDHLRYEEEIRLKLNDLPLPDENMAWADMRSRLEEDDDDRIVPVWLRGCIVSLLLGLSLFGAGWWLLSPDKFSESRKSGNNKTAITENAPDTNRIQNNPVQPKAFNADTITQNKTEQIDLSTKANIVDSGLLKKIDKKRIKENAPEETNKKKSGYSTGTNKIHGDKRKEKSQANNGDILAEQVKIQQIKENKKIKTVRPSEKTKQSESDSINLQQEKGVASKDISPVKNIVITEEKPDSASLKITDTVKIKEPEQASVAKKRDDRDSSKKKRYTLGAGIAMHQQLPINGQKLTPYNSFGRKASLADYIPAVYLRLYRENKWYLQSEFRYGAPQYNKEFMYGQDVRTDSFSQSVITQSTTLKKTFYHQLPVTFNYFILPNWSVGAGVVWNKFNSAISTVDITSRNVQTGADSLLVKGKVISTKDSGYDDRFSKSYFQAVFESQYRWKRFSFGTRYAVGLQPYIKFTLPGGVNRKERNSSLFLFIRYELWRSKK